MEPVTDPTAPFAELDLSGVAAAHDLTTDALADALRRVQSSVREYPGVADLVFEYRRAFTVDPLVARHGDAYYLLVPPRVWPEYATAASLSEDERTACRVVHERAFRVVESDTDTADWDPLVLVG